MKEENNIDDVKLLKNRLEELERRIGEFEDEERRWKQWEMAMHGKIKQREKEILRLRAALNQMTGRGD